MSDFLQVFRRHGATAAALVLCVAHAASFDVGRLPILTDIRFFLYTAWRVAEGAVPHLAFFENKTQLATFVGALFYRIGDLLGADPLIAIRVGYLGIAVIGGMAAYFVFRRLSDDEGVPGVLGVLAYCSFGLLGLMPATGNIPKLLMAVYASIAALLAHRQRWVWAGVAGSLAFMDWQIGALVWVAVFVTALLHGRPRGRAAWKVSLGGAAGLAPFLLYYAVAGGLTETVRQVVGSTLFRGSSALAGSDPGQRLSKIAELVRLACPAQGWLFYLGLIGMVVVGFRLWKRWGGDESRLLLPLTIYHFGIVAFSLVDFQYYGDFFVLLHSVAFFLGAVWVAAYRLLPRHPAVPAIAVVLALLLARPSFLRPELELHTPIAEAGATLQDQQEVARQLDELIGDRQAAFLAHSELMFLTRRTNALPVVYWNRAVWSRLRESDGETYLDAGLRTLLSADADVLVPPRPLGYDALLRRGFDVRRLASGSGKYAVTVALRPSGNDAWDREPTPHSP